MGPGRPPLPSPHPFYREKWLRPCLQAHSPHLPPSPYLRVLAAPTPQVHFYRPKTKIGGNQAKSYIRSLPKARKTKKDQYAIVKEPLTSESAMKKIEDHNTLVFLVDPRSTKRSIAAAVEKVSAPPPPFAAWVFCVWCSQEDTHPSLLSWVALLARPAASMYFVCAPLLTLPSTLPHQPLSPFTTALRYQVPQGQHLDQA